MVTMKKATAKDKGKRGIHLYGKQNRLILEHWKVYADDKGFKTIWLHRSPRKKLKKVI